MNKLYPTRINWHNEPSTETPIDEINLNKMDKFCDDIDNRVIEIDGRVTNIEDIEPTVLGYATRAENAASDSEGYAVGKRGGQDVPSTDPTYHNNSKYYSDRALTSETNAATSETNAATSESNASTSATNAHTSETNAADSAETAEAYAIGERNGEPVTSEDVTYHNNSKFYAEQAGTSATNAATSESNASTSETNAATSESNAATSESHAATSESNAATSESNAEAWAVGERGGVPVTSEDETYENNARFYSGNADTKAEFADLRAVDSEAWSVGKRRGEPVLPSDETYHNNAKYWAEIAESVTNVFPMEGATDSTNGKGGLVPQPLAGDNKKALYGDGTWKDVKGRTWLAYIREYGTPFEANWLTLSPTGGVALTPDTEDLYLIKSSGKYYNVAVSWNGTEYEVTSKSAHIIVDEDGVSYPQRDKMKFFNAVIEDDAENDTTNVYVEGTGSIIVTPPTVTVETYTYNGQPQGPTIVWATGMEDKCVVTNATKTDAGTYTLTIALKNSNRMIWTDMTTADKTYSYTIAKQSLTVPTVDDTGLVYNGTAQFPTITGFDSDTMTKSGDTETDAGSYTVTFGLVDSDNYQWGGTNTVAWSIARANQTITLSSSSVTLNSNNLTATVTVSDNVGALSVSSSNTNVAAVSMSGDTITIVRQGSYTSSKSATITVTAASTSNYNQQTASISVTANYIAIYGVSWDGTSTTAWTRTDAAASFTDPVPYVAGASNYGSPFDNRMPWSGMKKVTNSAAGTLVEIPKFWYKLTQVGAGMKIQIASYAVSGYSVSPAHMDRGDGSGERDKIYVGRYQCATSTCKSTTGVKPGVGTRSNMRTAIHNLGSNIWQMDFATVFTIWLLYIVEFADWNSQKKIGYGCGDNSALRNMGYTDSMPYHTGTTQTSRTTYGLGTQYRYIEGLWDNIYTYYDGCYINSNGLNIILNPSSFSDSTGGIPVGGIVDEGFPTALDDQHISGTFPLFVATTLGGSNTTYTCDYWDMNAAKPCVYGGGQFNQSLNRGLFYISCISNAMAGSGSRLMKLP